MAKSIFYLNIDLDEQEGKHYSLFSLLFLYEEKPLLEVNTVLLYLTHFSFNNLNTKVIQFQRLPLNNLMP